MTLWEEEYFPQHTISLTTTAQHLFYYLQIRERPLFSLSLMPFRVSAKRGYTIWALQALFLLGDNAVNIYLLCRARGDALDG